jgi:HK97 family phage prohead protease
MTRDYGHLAPGHYKVDRFGHVTKQETRTLRGFVIEGVASKYDTILFHERLKYINIQPGAFDISMKYEAPVECWLDHEKSLCLKGCRVELFSDEQALNFRVHLDDSEIAGHARDLVECGLYSQVSLGWHSSKKITRDIGGTNVVFILQGTLTEISLVPAGAIKTTHAQVSKLKDCRSLAEDCKSLKFRADNSYVELQRALSRLETQ